tara:strand:+ start:16677 stop:16880 length:204 start_codon:yes stop_codon:yes gene_type:complete
MGDIVAKVPFLKGIGRDDPLFSYQVLVNVMKPCPRGLYLSVDQLAPGAGTLHLASELVPLVKGKVKF